MRLRKEGELELVKVDLKEDRLVVEKKDPIYEDIMATHVGSIL